MWQILILILSLNFMTNHAKLSFRSWDMTMHATTDGEHSESTMSWYVSLSFSFSLQVNLNLKFYYLDLDHLVSTATIDNHHHTS